MNAESKAGTAPSITGHMIALDPGHSIALYERKGEHYVAEFRGSRVELAYAATWFRFYAGALRYRDDLQSSMPISAEVLQIIERLHAESEAREQSMRALPRTLAAAARRYWINAISRLRGRGSKLGQTVG